MTKMPYGLAYSMNKDIMNNASEITYDIEKDELMFWKCEAVDLICDYPSYVSGTHKQLVNYYTKSLKDSFPNAKVTVK